MPSNIPFFNEEEIRQLLPHDKAVEAVEKSLVEYSKHDAVSTVMPLRATLFIEQYHGVLYSMPCFSKELDYLGVKLVSRFHDNHKLGLGPCHAIVIKFAANTGVPQMVFEAEEFSGIRTAAASAVSSKHLAVKGPKILAIIGAGLQAKHHILAHFAIFPGIQEVRVANRTASRAHGLIKELDDKRVVHCENVKEAVRDADIICTVTTSPSVVLEGNWINNPHAHVCGVGSHKETRELDDQVMTQATVYCDSYDSAYNESLAVTASGIKIYAELGEVLLGTKEAFREQRTVFMSQGIAIEDAHCADYVYRRWKGELH